MTRWKAARLLDRYVDADEAVVMLPDGRVLALGPIAWAVLDAISRGTSDVESLADQLVDLYGPPPTGNALDLTAGVLQELNSSGLVSQLFL